MHIVKGEKTPLEILDWIDSMSLKSANKLFTELSNTASDIDIYVDDEGMLKSGNFGRSVVGCDSPLFGTFIITGGVDSKGQSLSVPDELDILDVMKYVGEVEYVIR
jgi:hypothetical protein